MLTSLPVVFPALPHIRYSFITTKGISQVFLPRKQKARGAGSHFHFRIPITACLLLGLGCTSVHPIEIINADFSDTSGMAEGVDGKFFTGQAPGWTWSGSSVELVSYALNTDSPAPDGNTDYYFEAGTPEVGALTQTLSGFEPGARYRLVFDWGNRRGGFEHNYDFRIELGDGSFARSGSEFRDMEEGSFTLTASAETMELRVEINRADTHTGVALDNLRLHRIWSEDAKLAPGSLVSPDRFGDALAIDGDLMAIGAFDRAGSSGTQGDGAVFIFSRNEGGPDNWGLIREIPAPVPNGDFGFSVGLSGETLVVGARAEDRAGVDSGAAYVFERNEGGADQWGLVKTLASNDLAADDAFGASVDIDGDRIAVGATGANGSSGARGAAYIFERDFGGSGNWGEVRRILPAEGAGSFGFSIDLEGDEVLVGSITYNAPDVFFKGAALLFAKDEGGTDNWGQTARLLHPAGEVNDWFGWDVALDGDRAIVGMREAEGPADRQGAFLFERNAGGTGSWGFVREFQPADGEVSDRFGRAVELVGDDIFIGSMDWNNFQGRVQSYRFDSDVSEWQLRGIYTTDPAVQNTGLGGKIAAQQGLLVAGAFSEAGGRGAAYLFEVSTNPEITGSFATLPIVHYENTTLGPAPFTISDAETLSDDLVLSWETDNPTLLPPGSVTFGGTGTNRTITIDPAAETTGTATLTVTVRDGDNDPARITANLDIREIQTYGIWGVNRYGEADIPQDLGKVEKLAFGNWAAIALREDGTLRAWGQNFWGTMLTGLESLTGVIDITAGDLYTIYIQSDGSLAGQGFNLDNRLLVPAGNDFVQVEAGIGHSLARRSDGSLEVWGNAGSSPIPAGLGPVTAMDAGYPGLNAAVSGGSVTGWTHIAMANTPSELAADVIDVSLNWVHAIALKADGSVVTWGAGGAEIFNTPTLDDAVQASAGKWHSLVLRENGELLAWGDNRHFQSNVPAGLERVRFAEASWHGGAFILNEAPLLDGALTHTGTDGEAMLLTGLSITDPDAYDDPVRVDLDSTSGLLSLGVASGLTFLTGDGETDGSISFTASLVDANAALASLRLVGGDTSGGTIPVQVSVDDAHFYGIGSHVPATVTTDIDVSQIQPPVITGIADQTTDEDVLLSIPITLSDADAAAEDILLAVTSSDESLLPTSQMVIEGTGASRTLKITPAAHQSGGPVTITLTATDAFGTTSETFTLTVNPVNDLPTLTGLPSSAADWVHYAGSTLGPVSFTVGDVESAADDLSLSFSTDNASLFPAGAVAFGGSGSSRTFTIMLPSGVVGTGGLTIEVNDTEGGVTSHTMSFDIRALDFEFGAWGFNDHGQQDLPGGLFAVRDAAWSNTASMIVNGDGTLLVWGDNFHGQVSHLNGLTGVSQIETGDLFGIVLYENGSLGGGGWGGFGRTSVPAGNNFVAISSRSGNSAAVTDTGQFYYWGPSNVIPAALSSEVVTDVEVGTTDFRYGGALLESGQVRTWATWSNGNFINVDPSLTSNAIDFEMGEWFFSWLRNDGSVVGLGGPFGFGSATVFDDAPAQAISGGSQHLLILLENGEVVGHGWSNVFQSNIPAGLERVRWIEATRNGGVFARNLPPTISGSLTATGSQRSSIALPALTVADTDTYADPARLVIAPEHGTVSLGQLTGLTFHSGDGAADDVLDISGDLADLNAALATLTYEPNPGTWGDVAVTVSVDDLQYYGEGSHVPDAHTVTVTIDPVGASLADRETDAWSDGRYGQSIDIDGDWMVVGAPLKSYDGRALIYQRNASDPHAWDFVTEIAAPGGQPNDYFGVSAAIFGDRVVVGAHLADLPGAVDAGAAYVFERDAGGPDTFGHVATLSAPDPEAGALFGESVDLFLDRIVVGAQNADGFATDSGAAYVFDRADDGSFTLTAELFALDGATGDRFGGAVAAGGDIVAVGAEFRNGVFSDDGAVYLFREDQTGFGLFEESAILQASQPEAGAAFGTSLDMNGLGLVVGAPFEDAGGADRGSAYVFTGDPVDLANWGESARLVAPQPEDGGRFGASVALSGAWLGVGERFADDTGADSGRVQLFEQLTSGDGSWLRAATLANSQQLDGADFGGFTSIALQGGSLVAGSAPLQFVESFEISGYAETAPERFDLAAPQLGQIFEDVDSLSNAGMPVWQLTRQSGIDANGDLLGIALVAADNSNGGWEYSINNGDSWIAVGSVSETAVLLLGPEALLRFNPNANYAGNASISFRLWDGRGGSGGTTLDLTGLTGGANAFSGSTVSATQPIESVYDPTTISDIPDQAVAPEDTSLDVPFTMTAFEVPIGDVSVSVSSNMPELIPNDGSALQLLGTGTSRTLRITPVENRFGGPVTITVTVDDTLETIIESFELTVTPVSDAPVFVSTPKDHYLDPGLNPGPLDFTIDDVDAPATPLSAITVEATSSNQALLPDANLTVTGTGATRSVSFTPLAGQTGEAVVTLTLVDGSFRVSNSFLVSIAGSATKLVGSGFDSYDQTDTVRPPLGHLTSLSAYQYSVGGLRSDGTLGVRGGPDLYRSLPAGQFSRVEVSRYFAAAIDSDGDLHIWGPDWFGTLSPDYGEHTGPFIDLAVGLYDVVALRADGRIEHFGLYSLPTDLSTVTFSMIGASRYVFFGKRADTGEIRKWGSTNRVSSELPQDVNMIQIEGGSGVAIGRTSGGKVYTWGDNRPSTLPSASLDAVDVGIAYTGDHAIALRSDGAVLVWGRAYASGVRVEVLPPGSPVVAVSGGNQTVTALLDDGTILYFGEIEDILRDQYYYSPLTEDPVNLQKIATNGNTSLGLRADGSVVAWGYGGYYGLTAVPDDLPPAKDLAVSYHVAAIITAEGEVEAWGIGSSQLNVSNIAAWSDVEKLHGSPFGIAAIHTDGSVSMEHYFANLESVPETVSNIVDIALSYNQVIVMDSSGTVHAWDRYPGSNTLDGQTGVKDVAASLYGHTYLLLADGSVQAIDGRTPPSDLPPLVSIEAGNGFAGGVDASGRLHMWGNNPHNVLSFENTVERPVALAFAGSTALALDTVEANVISGFTDLVLHEDASSPSLGISVDDAGGSATSFAIESLNESLIPSASVSLTGAGSARELSFAVAPDSSGKGSLLLRTEDGQSVRLSEAIVTVEPVNDAPAFTASEPAAVDEDAGSIQIANWASFDAGPADEEATQSVQAYLVDNLSNPALFAAEPSIDASGTLTYTPAPDANGSSTFSVRVQDDGTENGGVDISPAQTFTITVNPVNDAPTITAIADVVIDEDGSTGTIPVLVSDLEMDAGALSLSVTAADETLLPAGGISLVGSGANRSLTLTPAANTNGSTTLVVTVSDGGASAQTSFNLTVNAVNDAPTISAIADQTIDEDSATGALSFSVSDVETDAGLLTVTAASSDETLLPPTGISLADSGSSRTITLTPASDAHGSATVTLAVSDGSLSSQTTFNVTVNPINDAPTIAPIANQTIDEDSSTGALSFTIGDVETDAGNLVVTAASSNSSLVAQSGLAIEGTGSERTLTVTPEAGATGTATITVSVDDEAGDSSDTTFLLTVEAVVPVLSFVSWPKNYVVVPGREPDTLSFEIASSAGIASLDSVVVEAVSSNQELISDASIEVGGTGANRTLDFTLASGETGRTDITLRLLWEGEMLAEEAFFVEVGSVESQDFSLPFGASAFSDVSNIVQLAHYRFLRAARTADDRVLYREQSLTLDLNIPGVSDIAVDTYNLYALAGGQVQGWKVWSGGQQPWIDQAATWTNIEKVEAWQSGLVGLDSNGKLHFAGTIHGGTVPPDPGTVFDVVANYYSYAFLLDDGTVVSWPSAVVRPYPDTLKAQAIADGAAFILELGTDGKLRGWWTDGLTTPTSFELAPDKTFEEVYATGPYAAGREIGGRWIWWRLNYGEVFQSELESLSQETISFSKGDQYTYDTTHQFGLIMEPVDLSPSLVLAEDAAVTEDFPFPSINESAAPVSVIVESQAPGLIDDAGIQLLSSYDPLSLQVSPLPDQHGQGDIWFDLEFSQTVYLGTIRATVNPVNDPPSFAATNPPPVAEDAGPQTIANWATFDAGPDNEDAEQSVLAYQVTVTDNAGLFSEEPTVDTSGTLRYTPADNAFGTATFEVSVQDDGGTSNGGVATFTVQTFTITVNAVNDPPVITFDSGVWETVDATANAIVSLFVEDVDDPLGDLQITATSTNTNLVSDGGLTIQLVAGGYELNIPLATGTTGFGAIEVEISDGVLTDTVLVPVRVDRAITPGSILVWGAYDNQQQAYPDNLDNVIQIATGETSVSVLRADGTFADWGNRVNVTQSYVPGMVTGYGVYGRKDNTFAVFDAGQTNSWGASAYGEASVDSVEGFRPVQKVVNTDKVAVALKRNGTLGGAGDPMELAALQSAGMKTVEGVVDIVAGDAHVVALLHDGSVQVFDASGEIAEPAVNSGISDITAGTRFVAILRDDATVETWGTTSAHAEVFNVPASLVEPIDIDAQHDHVLALEADGTVVGWGNNADNKATPPQGLTGVQAVSAGGTHSVALLDSTEPWDIDFTSASLWENMSPGSEAGTFSLYPVPDTPVSYTVVVDIGTDYELFEAAGNRIQTTDFLDYESKSIYLATIQAEGPYWTYDREMITIELLNVDRTDLLAWRDAQLDPLGLPAHMLELDADPDGDGLPTVFERALDTHSGQQNPPEFLPRVQLVEESGQLYLELTYRRLISMPLDVRLKYQYSADGTEWVDAQPSGGMTEQVAPLDSTHEEVTVRMNDPLNLIDLPYVRLIAVPEEQP